MCCIRWCIKFKVAALHHIEWWLIKCIPFSSTALMHPHVSQFSAIRVGGQMTRSVGIFRDGSPSSHSLRVFLSPHTLNAFLSRSLDSHVDKFLSPWRGASRSICGRSWTVTIAFLIRMIPSCFGLIKRSYWLISVLSCAIRRHLPFWDNLTTLRLAGIKLFSYLQITHAFKTSLPSSPLFPPGQIGQPAHVHPGSPQPYFHWAIYLCLLWWDYFWGRPIAKAPIFPPQKSTSGFGKP